MDKKNLEKGPKVYRLGSEPGMHIRNVAADIS